MGKQSGFSEFEVKKVSVCCVCKVTKLFIIVAGKVHAQKQFCMIFI